MNIIAVIRSQVTRARNVEELFMNIDAGKILGGRWQGPGLGQYPTIESFEYLETVRFTMDAGRALLHYTMHMHTTKLPHLALHLEATLQRQ